MTREEAIKFLELDKKDRGECFISDAIDMAIKALEQEPKTGHWIEDEYEMEVRCSSCGEENDECSKYCPNCGAKMVEPQESEEKYDTDR